MIDALVLASFFALATLSVPLAIVIGCTALLALSLLTHAPLLIMAKEMYRAVDTTVLMAIPLFILAGNIMTTGQTARRLINSIQVFVGHINGGMAVTGVMACMFFAAISGSSLATVAAIGSILIPAMIKAGYGERFTLGLFTCAGSLGIMIPPSIPMILYGGIMDVSVTRQFMAGVGPGLLLGLVLIIYSYLLSRRHGWRQEGGMSWSRGTEALRHSVWALGLPILVLGGIYSGMFTPTEASAVSVVYVVFVEILIYKELKLKNLFVIARDSAVFSGCILFILCNSTALSWFLASEEIPDKLAAIIFSVINSKWIFLAVVNVFLIFVGCFLDIITAMIILMPLLAPLVERFEIDLVHFGIIFIFNLELGFLTPPMGPNLYVASAVSNRSFLEVAISVVPYILLMACCLLAITYIPEISLWLPQLLY
jgi:C4-dicarboxylate transporter, DctM subunit